MTSTITLSHGDTITLTAQDSDGTSAHPLWSNPSNFHIDWRSLMENFNFSTFNAEGSKLKVTFGNETYVYHEANSNTNPSVQWWYNNNVAVKSSTIVGPGGSSPIPATNGESITIEYTSDGIDEGDVTLTYKTAFFTVNSSSDSGTSSVPICFMKDTMVTTDQGTVAIQNILPGTHTINYNDVEFITQTITPENHMILVEKDAISEGVPNRDTYISKNHKIKYEGMWRMARWLPDENKKIHRVPYEGDILYNVAMEKHQSMYCNNMKVETLNPKTEIYKILKQRKSNNRIIETV